MICFYFYRFLHELAQIPNFAERAQCIIFRAVFSESVTSLHRKVEIVTRASKVCLPFDLKPALPLLGGNEEMRGEEDPTLVIYRMKVICTLHWLLKGNVVFVLSKCMEGREGKKKGDRNWRKKGKREKQSFLQILRKKIVTTSPCTYWPPKTKNKIVRSLFNSSNHKDFTWSPCRRSPEICLHRKKKTSWRLEVTDCDCEWLTHTFCVHHTLYKAHV